MIVFPKKLTRFAPQVLHFIMLSLFFLLWAVMYRPKPLVDFLMTGDGYFEIKNIFGFNLYIVFSIILVSLALMRVLYYFLRNVMKPNLTKYLLWCLLELITVSFFVAIYITLMDKASEKFFLEFWLNSFWLLSSSLIYPYVTLLLVLYIEELSEKQEVDEGTRLKFYDSRHILKFVTTGNSILFIKAEENYVEINYLDNGIVKRYQLRNTMKSVEPLCEKVGMVRSHRSFFVNPSHISILKKEKNGLLFAVMDSGVSEMIPVSKKYYDVVSSML